MARLRFGRPISLRWNGLLLEGPANTVFEIPDEYYEEFNQDIGPVEPTLVWLDADEGSTLRARVTALEAGGGGGGAALSSDPALALGTAAAGSGLEASRDDHVHPTTGLALSGHNHSGVYEPVNTAILKSVVDAKGDLIVGTASDTVDRLPGSGTNGYVLTYDSAETTGLKWAAAPGSGGGASVGNATPLALGTASAGDDTTASREDHVHPTTGLSLSGHNHDAAYAPLGSEGRADIVYEVCKNSSGTTIPAYSVVYINGADGTNPTISLADADTEATSSKTLGFTETSSSNGDTVTVLTQGRLTGVDTSAASTEGVAVWLSSTAGGYVFGTPPAEPAHSVYLGVVTKKNVSTGEIFVKVQNGYELDELHDVSAASPINGDILQYNSTSGMWEKESLSTAGIAAATHTHAQGDVTNLTTDLADKISKTIVDAKGDLIVATAADTVSRLAVSATPGDVLTVDSSTATGLKWAAPAAGGVTATSTDTFQNKTIDLSNNTVSGTLAQFNTAVSDADLVSIAGTETLTNKTLTLPYIENIRGNYTTTVGSATSITLTSSSTFYQFVTGNAAQTVVFPDTSTLTVGHAFEVHNNMSSSSITLRTSTNLQIGSSVGIGVSVRVTCISTADNSASAFDVEIIGSNLSTGSGSAVFGTSPSISSPSISGTATMSGGIRFNYTSVTSAATTTTLSTSSNILLTITGTTTHTVATPSSNSTGSFWIVRNDSTGNVTVQTSAAALLATLTTGQAVMIHPLSNNATTAATFAVYYLPNSAPASQSLTLNQQTGTTYTLQASDLNKLVEVSNTGAITVTVPANILAVGDQIHIMQTNTGQITVAAGANVAAVNSALGLKLRARWSSATLIKRVTSTNADQWVLVGDTAV